MKELLEQLRTINEEISLSSDEYINVLKASFDFSMYGEELDELNNEEPIQVSQSEVNGFPSCNSSKEPYIHIMTYEDFEDLLMDCAISYKVDHINDLLEPYFVDSEYYENCKKDAILRDFILSEVANITKVELVDYNNKSYAIVQE